MKIFISHASADREVVNGLVDLIQLGTGVGHSEIFYSSRDGDIRNGTFFVQSILSALSAADLICCVLSRPYFDSEFCIAEVGAAQVRSVAGQTVLYSLIVPPTTFNDLGGVLHGVQSGIITKAASLNQLRDRIGKKLGATLPTDTWEKARDAFLKHVQPLVAHAEAQESLGKIEIEDILVDRSLAIGVTFTNKLRIVFRNKSGISLNVGPAEWDSGVQGVRLQADISPLSLQVKPTGANWGTEGPTVIVPKARPFRVWIPLQPSTTEADVLKRFATNQIGTLTLTVDIGGNTVSRSFKL